MKLFSVVIAGAFATANAAEHYTPVGAPPICEVDAQGYTHVYYQDTLHPSFKCTHSGSTCACTLQHPTHHKGGCKQLESKAAGKILDTGGDCTDSGKNTPAPTPAPTPPPTSAICVELPGGQRAGHVRQLPGGSSIGNTKEECRLKCEARIACKQGQWVDSTGGCWLTEEASFTHERLWGVVWATWHCN